MEHITNIRIYYEDTDAAGVVYYANYLKFAERARTEFLRDLGFENKALMETQGIALVVRHIEADYLKPAHLDDSLEMQTYFIQLKNARFIMKQSLFRGDVLIFTMNVTLACFDVNKEAPRRLPDDLKKAFAPYLI